MLPRKYAIRLLMIVLILCLPLPAFCVGEAAPGVWDGKQYTNQQSGVHFTLPENWVFDPDHLLPNPFFDVLASDQTRANAIAIGWIDLSELIKLVPAEALGPYAGVISQMDLSKFDSRIIMSMITSMFKGNFGGDSGVQSSAIMVGDAEYTLIAIDLYEGALLESLLLRPAGRQMSVIMFSSSDHTGVEWFLSHFS